MRRRWIIAPVVALLGAAGAVYGIGALLPARHVAAVSAHIAADPVHVARLVREVEQQPSWRPGVRRVDVLQRKRGLVRYREHGNEGAIIYELVELAPDRRFRSTILEEGLPFGGAWTIDLYPAGSTVRVSIEERGVVHDPLYRFLSRFVFGHETTMKTYLADLERAAARER